MKKKILLGFIFLFITIFTFNSLFYAEKHNRYSEMINIGETKVIRLLFLIQGEVQKIFIKY
ncbi:hypothetical protein KPL26_08605 [Clostridium algidicarnis]|uniref:hypothetical protein n=1 Tax=Clostridium algidicarnis TaxID=37659 RepID=UPI001C0E0346|nr:hypothetical protein [Clostridium algidicarnis]MBU3196734.1 hypothetical protein [Clostridium algidicarnis]